MNKAKEEILKIIISEDGKEIKIITNPNSDICGSGEGKTVNSFAKNLGEVTSQTCDGSIILFGDYFCG